jgi:hypothetical protein
MGDQRRNRLPPPAASRRENDSTRCSERSPRDFFYRNVDEEAMQISRWMSVLYFVTALAAPVLLYAGPDVLSPAAPAIANAALDGRFTLHPHTACKASATATRPSTPAARC